MLAGDMSVSLLMIVTSLRQIYWALNLY